MRFLKSQFPYGNPNRVLYVDHVPAILLNLLVSSWVFYVDNHASFILLLQSVRLWFRVCFSENVITSLLLSIVLPLFQKSLLSRECRSLPDLNSFYPLSLISCCLKLAYFTVLFNYFSFAEFRVFYLDFGILVHTSLSRSSQIFTLNHSL